PPSAASASGSPAASFYTVVFIYLYSLLSKKTIAEGSHIPIEKGVDAAVEGDKTYTQELHNIGAECGCSSETKIRAETRSRQKRYVPRHNSAGNAGHVPFCLKSPSLASLMAFIRPWGP
uniref:Uncharacterized protein n=1 Tax=Xenopus tropicalis TaxID=8364 RepID=A0A6I8RNQ8_XENTR